MNPIQARLTADMKAAMKAGDKDRVQVLRLMIAALKDAQLRNDTDEMSEQQEIAVLRKQVKIRREAIEQAEAAGRTDFAEQERGEIEVIETYLPKMLTGAELAARVRAVADEIGYSGPSDKGRFMKEWMSRFKGQADGRDVQDALTQLG